MFRRDHAPPHSHAKYGLEEITGEGKSGIVNGSMSKRALQMVQEGRGCILLIVSSMPILFLDFGRQKHSFYNRATVCFR
ncbi:MAG: hypothetical protein GF398_01650 [Chitinivibrionales bacterium]|nr:hypothetical protein [Chitinivibrionales bacterium]